MILGRLASLARDSWLGRVAAQVLDQSRIEVRAAQEVKLEAVKEAAAAEVSEAIKDAKTPAEKIAIADQIIAENAPKPSDDAPSARSAASATKP